MQTDQLTDHLVNDYFGMHRLEWENEVDFQLPYGEWIRLFRRTGFVVEDLIETQSSKDAASTYRDAPQTAWARRWPIREHLESEKISPIQVNTGRKNESEYKDDENNQNNPAHLISSSGR